MSNYLVLHAEDLTEVIAKANDAIRLTALEMGYTKLSLVGLNEEALEVKTSANGNIQIGYGQVSSNIFANRRGSAFPAFNSTAAPVVIALIVGAVKRALTTTGATSSEISQALARQMTVATSYNRRDSQGRFWPVPTFSFYFNNSPASSAAPTTETESPPAEEPKASPKTRKAPKPRSTPVTANDDIPF